VGSIGGLIALGQGLAHVAGVHLFDPETATYNLPFLKTYLSGKAVFLINLFYRQQGLMVKNGNPLNITGIQDLVREEVRFVNRQKGSGTRVLLDTELKRLGIEPDEIHGYHHEVDTHMAVAMEVLMGKATCGLGAYAMAKTLGLGFVPVCEERYDLAVLSENATLPQVQALFAVIRGDKFQGALRELGGYDLRDTGKMFWEGKVE
jgi:putative molybdopterin biosynthesis protein